MRWPTRIRAPVTIALLLSGALAYAAAQEPEAPGTQQSSPRVEDPFGRATPRATVSGFIRAAEHDDFVAAANYLELEDRPPRDAEALARDLKALMDRYFSQALTTVSDAPRGALYDGLPVDREQIGPLVIGEEEVYIELVRTTGSRTGPIWLISSETLARIPSLHAAIGKSWIERTMPAGLVQRGLLGISLAHWVVLLVALAVPFFALAVLTAALAAVARRVLDGAGGRRDVDAWYAGIRWPFVCSLAIAIQLMAIPALGFRSRSASRTRAWRSSRSLSRSRGCCAAR